MQLPWPLVRLRTALAQMVAFIVRAAAPIQVRFMKFIYEIWGRSQLRGHVEPGVHFIGLITVEGSQNVHVGKGTRLGRRTFLKTDGAGRIDIGRNVTINDGATIVAYDHIAIGDNAMIGEYVTIRDADHGTRRDQIVRTQDHKAASITIGPDAWVARGVCVLKGAKIADGAIVGANSVVTKGVEPYTIVVGAPAEKIGERRA